MMSKVLLLAVFGAVLLVSNCAADASSDVDILQKEIKERTEKIEEVIEKIKNSSRTYYEMAGERLNFMQYLYDSIEKAISKTNKEAVIVGVKEKRWFINYECLMDNEKIARNYLKKYYGNYPQDMAKLIEKNAASTAAFVTIAENIYNWLHELNEEKKAEILEAEDAKASKEILDEVIKYLKQVDQIVIDLESKIFKQLFTFFGQFVDTSYAVEILMRFVTTVDSPKMLQCMTLKK